jgi:hypothetical protein
VSSSEFKAIDLILMLLPIKLVSFVAIMIVVLSPIFFRGALGSLVEVLYTKNEFSNAIKKPPSSRDIMHSIGWPL